jgi:hypothetical protein
MAPREPALDPLFALTWAAAHTSTVRLVTAIVILPQRNPVVLAKEVASLDVLSGGRVTPAVGADLNPYEPDLRKPADGDAVPIPPHKISAGQAMIAMCPSGDCTKKPMAAHGEVLAG